MESCCWRDPADPDWLSELTYYAISYDREWGDYLEEHWAWWYDPQPRQSWHVGNRSDGEHGVDDSNRGSDPDKQNINNLDWNHQSGNYETKRRRLTRKKSLAHHGSVMEAASDKKSMFSKDVLVTTSGQQCQELASSGSSSTAPGENLTWLLLGPTAPGSQKQFSEKDWAELWQPASGPATKPTTATTIIKASSEKIRIFNDNIAKTFVNK